ncbi:uncharacterized protein LOC144869531 isoform X2 [Branchiostoma floridae x Branchiostoma japonicum]
MGPDILAQSVQQESEVTAEVEKEVADDTVDKIFALTEHDKKDEEGANGDGGDHEIKAEVDFVPDKGMVEDDMFAPPGMHMKVDVEEDPGKDSEPDGSSQPMAFSYPVGMGSALMNGCFGTGYGPGDPCYDLKVAEPACYNMMEGCGYIGVGFDGRGDYNSRSRRKTVVQRNCKNRATYHDEDVPDNMNVHGIFDTDVSSYVFESREAYRHSLQMKAGMSFSGFGFQGAVESAYGKSTSNEKQSFMSLIQCNVVRYEIFLDEISPDTLSLPFLRDFLSLPKHFIEGKAQLQKFILRYGTHFIKSATFGGSFKLFKTQEASQTESLEDFSIQAQASYNSLFFNAGGHAGFGMSSGSSSSSKTSSTHVTIEGGDQEVASIVADFYSTGFKDTFTEWLKSIPTFPKPIEMFMGTMSELLNLNYRLLFPFDIGDAASGCFSENLRTEEGTGRKYYEVAKLVNKTHGVETVNEKRYCDFTSAERFEEAMDRKRLALERAIVIYMEEGPVPTTDFHLKGGKPGCTTQALKLRGGAAGTTYPTWLELINGDTYRIIFDLPESINYDLQKNTEAFLVFARNRWNCHGPGADVHLYDSYVNGGSGDTNNKKVSCFGFVMTYVESTGTFSVTPQDQEASKQELKNLPRNYANKDVASAEYISPLEHSQAKGGAMASIVEAPCTVKWSNSYQIKPAEEGGRCLYFFAASAGDIFVVFSAIPRDKTTWYHVQISFQGVALYKGMQLVKYEGAKKARSLGDPKLFQPYFICLEEDNEKMQTYIKYGIGSDTSEKGLVYMVYIDKSPPLGIRFYSFGTGENDLEIMDARVIEGGATGEMECSGGTVLEDGICVEDCHPECNGCIPRSPGSKLDTECRSCKHFSIPKGGGLIQCVAECPPDTIAAADGVTCICKDFVVVKDDGSNQCVSACPADKKVASDGKTCGSKWRDDSRCGPSFPAKGANPGQCDPGGPNPCCSSQGYCGSTEAHCTCEGCEDYRYEWLAQDSSWVVDSSGTPWVSNGVTHDAAKALDGVAKTFWNPVGTVRHSVRHIVLDLKEPHTLSRIALNNYGNTLHDIKAFKLQKSTLWSPFHWEDVVSVTDVKVGTDRRQEFGGFRATARYWRFLITRTSEGWQPRLRELNLLGVLSPRNPSPAKWRDDHRCGPSIPTEGGNPAQCNPKGPTPCCSNGGWCGSTEAHCTCDGCKDYRYEWLARDSSWVVDSSGTPWVSNGVTHDAAKALDGVAGTYWNPVGTDRHSARHIVLDLKEPHTLSRIALNNFGNTVHDIKAFKLQKSTLWSPFHWEDVVSVTDVEVGTDRRQEFGGFKATARYWRFLITETSEGWQPRLRELNLLGVLSPRNPSPAKWRDDHRCGPNHPTEGGNPAQCNPGGPYRCCSNGGWCGSTAAHCTCHGCVNYG